jgi:hypothetical protein
VITVVQCRFNRSGEGTNWEQEGTVEDPWITFDTQKSTAAAELLSASKDKDKAKALRWCFQC